MSNRNPKASRHARRIACAFARLRTKNVERPWRKHDNIPL
jgi:hypothetical protein